MKKIALIIIIALTLVAWKGGYEEPTGGFVDEGTIMRLATSTDSVGIGTATPGAKLEVAGTVLLSAFSTGDFINDEYDLRVGANDSASVMRIGGLELGTSEDRTVAPGFTAGGAAYFSLVSTPDGIAEFVFTTSDGNIRQAMPIAGAGYGTLNARSGMYAGPSVMNDSIMMGTYWGFDKLLMDTDSTGADLGVQNDVQIGNNLYVDGAVFVGVAAMANMTGLVVEGGVLGVKAITTPTADAGYGKFYVKADSNAYYQDIVGIEHTLLKGSSSIQHLFELPLEDPTGTVGNWDIIEINATQAVHFACQIPEDFEVLDAATIVMIPDASETIQWDILVSVAAAGEAYNNDDRSSLNDTLAVTINLITEVDISGSLTGLSAGDYVAIDFQSDTGNLRIVGFEFDFN